MARHRNRLHCQQSTGSGDSRNTHVCSSVARLLVVLVVTGQCAESFVIASQFGRNSRPLNRYPATKSQEVTSTATTDALTSTWSLSASSTRGESRFGLRRRVKAVLQNAKNRTGLPNLNSEANILESSVDTQDLHELFDDNDEYFEREGSSDTATRSDVNGAPSSRQRNNAVVFESSGRSAPATSTTPTIRVKPLPFTLPTLTDEQNKLLLKGERVQYQAKMGREGNGFVVVDVRAPPYVVWESLLDFEAYPEQIDTVRSMQMFTSTHLNSSYIAEDPVTPATTRSMRHYGRASVTRASFVLSKFRLNIAAVHKYRPHPDGHYMTFTLDKACKNVVLQDAKGIWYTQACPDGRQDYTRVWLLCELKVSPLLPTFIVDYAARRAMPRATTWLKPIVETSANRWLGTGM